VPVSSRATIQPEVTDSVGRIAPSAAYSLPRAVNEHPDRLLAGPHHGIARAGSHGIAQPHLDDITAVQPRVQALIDAEAAVPAGGEAVDAHLQRRDGAQATSESGCQNKLAGI